jgi:hypothetical protein
MKISMNLEACCFKRVNVTYPVPVFQQHDVTFISLMYYNQSMVIGIIDQDPCCSLSVSLLVIGFVSEQHGS